MFTDVQSQNLLFFFWIRELKLIQGEIFFIQLEDTRCDKETLIFVFIRHKVLKPYSFFEVASLDNYNLGMIPADDT